MKRIVIASLSLFLATSAFADTVHLPKTGQTTCYTDAGVLTACAGTGQDGYLQKGVTWPNPRFVDNNNGTFTDTMTGLVWLSYASCFPITTWQTNLNTAKALKGDGTQCNLTDGSVAGDWRMPSINELESLIDLSQSNPPLPKPNAFNNVKVVFNTAYITSTTMPASPGYAYTINMMDGRLEYLSKSNSDYLTNVRTSVTRMCQDIGYL